MGSGRCEEFGWDRWGVRSVVGVGSVGGVWVGGQGVRCVGGVGEMGEWRVGIGGQGRWEGEA